MRTGVRAALAAMLLAAALAATAAAEDPEGSAQTGTTPADSAAAAGEQAPAAPAALLPEGPVPEMPALGAPDSVRSNLWLVQALFGQIVRQSAAALPPPPAAVALQPIVRSDTNPLFQSVADRILRERGYELFLDETQIAVKDKPAQPPKLPAGACVLRFACEDVKLAYPDSYRRFGLWRQWVDREVSAAVMVTMLDKDSGRILFDQRLARSFADRVPAREFATVGTPGYGIAGAELKESGWRRYLEGVVVIGTLAGLVAIYFANTGG